MESSTRVFWSIRKLAKEYDLPRRVVGTILRSIGAKKWSYVAYYYDSEEEESNTESLMCIG